MNKNGEKDLIKMQHWPSSQVIDRNLNVDRTDSWFPRTQTDTETESLKHTKSETKTKRSKIETNYISVILQKATIFERQ